MKNIELVIKKRQNDWHVCIKGREGVWAAGKNFKEAIGDLVYFHPEVFGIDKIDLVGEFKFEDLS